MRFLKMYGVEQKLFFRSQDVIIFNLAMPLVTFILITMIVGGRYAADSGLTYLQSSYVALSTVGICCSAFMSIPITIVEHRSQGVLKRIYCSPCSPARLLACDTIACGVMAVISTLIVTLAAVGLFRVQNGGKRDCVCRYLAAYHVFHVFHRTDGGKPVPDNKINECGYDTDLLPHAAAVRRDCSGGDFPGRPSGCRSRAASWRGNRAAEIRIHGVVWWNGSAGGCSDSYCSGLQRNRHQNFQMGVIH